VASRSRQKQHHCFIAWASRFLINSFTTLNFLSQEKLRKVTRIIRDLQNRKLQPYIQFLFLHETRLQPAASMSKEG